MSRVTFIFNSGRTVFTHEAQARLLKRMGKGDYVTRDMADKPKAIKDFAFPGGPDTRTIEEVSDFIKSENAALFDDGLDSLDRDALLSIAQKRGIKVHHRTGADKLREALRAA